jgi:hypothetical protein
MMRTPIISRRESLQILRNTLRKTALEEHAAELKSATAEDRKRIIAWIEQEIDKAIKERLKADQWWTFLKV